MQYYYFEIHRERERSDEDLSIGVEMTGPGAAAELKKLATVGEDDECNLGITENRKLISFLQ